MIGVVAMSLREIDWTREVIQESDEPTTSERLTELHRIFVTGPGRGEVRRTAVGWQPDPSYAETKGKTASGQREYSKVERKAK